MSKVLITPEALRDKPGPHVDVLSQAGFQVVFPTDPHLARGLGGEEATIRELKDVDAVMASGEVYTHRVLQSLPQLRVVSRVGVGYDAVNVQALTEHNVPLTITPTANHEAVAEMTLALTLAVTRFLLVNDRAVRAGGWPRRLPMPQRGRTFGILGLGRIGRSVALRAHALQMNVIACEQKPHLPFVTELGIQLVSFDELLAQSDILSIHCPLNAETTGLFNRDVLARMKRGSVLINTARGRIVVEADLVEALQSGHLLGAGLDVFENEPPAPDNPLLQCDNVVLSPHVGGTDQLSMIAMAVESAECIVKLKRGEWPEGAVVNDQLRRGWTWK